ncbi:MAG: hypothetical protein LBJ88_03300 [Campylobacteraceae bacterium]|jgi:hypothetical protein|nr:hypothetical protein [Campylobacteraceae bacterium]
MEIIIKDIFATFGIVIGITICIAYIIYNVFKYFCEKLVEKYISKSIDEYRNELNKELEKYKYETNILFHRISKIHEKEFDVLPEIFSLMIDAYNSLSEATSILKEYADVERMDEIEFENFIKNEDLPSNCKDQLKSECPEERAKNYQKLINKKTILNSRKKIEQFHFFVQKNSLFLSDDLKEQFLKIDDLMWEINIKIEIGEDTEDQKIKISAWQKTKNDINPIIKEIEKLTQKRLRFDKA